MNIKFYNNKKYKKTILKYSRNLFMKKNTLDNILIKNNDFKIDIEFN